MAEENKYDHDSVQELLAWAKETLSNKSYPDGKFQINKATTVLDCTSFLSSMIQMISRFAHGKYSFLIINSFFPVI